MSGAPRRAVAAAAELWAAMDRPVRGRRVPGSLAIGLVAFAVAVVAGVISARTGANTWYADSLSHATIARRIFDDKAPGFQQLGTVWLPMPHLLLIPFVANTWMWSSGVGATCLGGLCSTATATALYRIVSRLGFGRWPRLIAVLVLLTDLGYQYVCTTALTEPVLIAAFTMTIAGLTHWATAARPLSGGELALYAGLPATVALLSRYEGWVLVLALVPYIAMVEARRQKDRTSLWRFIAVRRLLPALAVPAIGVVCPFIGVAWWLSYNFAIYRNPLEFATGPYSALRQQANDIARGLVTTDHDLGMSLYVYHWTTWEILGGFVVVTGFAGFLLVFFVEGLSVRTLTLGLALSTYAFMVVSLYLGQTVIWNDHSVPPALWNVRFGISPIIFFALGLAALLEYVGGWLHRRTTLSVVRPVLAVGAAAALLAQLAWTAADPVTRSPVVAEGHLSLVLRPMKVIDYLRAHYRGGNILIDESAPQNAFIPLVGLRNDQYWDLSAGAGYNRARRQPTTHAAWVVVNTAMHTDYPDPLWLYMRAHPQDYADYRVVVRDGTEELFHYEPGPAA